MVKLEMLVDGLPDFGTDHTPLNYAAIAQAAGIHSVRIEQPAEVRSALTEAFAHPGPALVDLVTEPNALSIPPHITTTPGDGFRTGRHKSRVQRRRRKILKITQTNVRNIRRQCPFTSPILSEPSDGACTLNIAPA
jgi:pyruvate dehydrogenase (quinone)